MDFKKYSCPTLALAAICGKQSLLWWKWAVLHCKTKFVGRVGTELRVQMWLRQLISSMFISRSGNTNSSYMCFYVSCVNVIVEDAVRTAKVRRSSHRKSTSLKSPRNFLKKKAANDLLQWPTSPKWHIFAHHLLDCSIAPPCADLGLCCDRSKPPRGRDVEQSSPRPDWIQNRRRILVDDLRSFRRRRSKQNERLMWRHCICIQSTFSWHIDAETKWAPFLRRRFQRHCLELKYNDIY